MKVKLLFAVLFLFSVVPTHAATVTAGDLAAYCKEAQIAMHNPEVTVTITINTGMCFGYVRGFMDGSSETYAFDEDGTIYKFSFRAKTVLEVIDAFVAYVQANPDKSKDAPSVVLLAAALKAKLATVTVVHIAPKGIEQ